MLLALLLTDPSFCLNNRSVQCCGLISQCIVQSGGLSLHIRILMIFDEDLCLCHQSLTNAHSEQTSVPVERDMCTISTGITCFHSSADVFNFLQQK